MARPWKAVSRTLYPPSAIETARAVAIGARCAPVTFLTFGGGNQRFRTSALSLANEAIKCGWFDRVVLASDEVTRPTALSTAVEFRQPMFDEQEQTFVDAHPRGYGYWLWKPILVHALLETMNEGDILLYADGGSELSCLGARRFNQYLELAHRHDGLMFRLPHMELHYTKREVFDFFSTPPTDRETGQVLATHFFLKNCSNARALVREWLAACKIGNMRLLTDDNDPLKQDPGFAGHRHDQSLLSLLVKTSDIKVIDQEDQFDKRLYRMINSWVLLFPLHARRARPVRIVPLMASISTEVSCWRALDYPLSFKAQFFVQSIFARRLRPSELAKVLFRRPS